MLENDNILLGTYSGQIAVSEAGCQKWVTCFLKAYTSASSV